LFGIAPVASQGSSFREMVTLPSMDQQHSP
jgi:hypothetical protein